ncbi:MAG: monovalent cation:proton antiporter-2 (CPA2) family protein [Candidatus Caenarcaniphilales bacterium]|nr:monovalent cation:proton antiporter-2 (CPA2) family protein [Candidatus Caenarcaniphilales bacterium]
MSNILLLNIFAFLAAACIVVPLTSRFKLGSVLGYLVAGIVIGPFGLGLIKDPEKIMHFAEFGVVMMLFLIGLELEPPVLWRLRKSIIGLGGLQVLLTTLVFMLLAISLGYSWQMSLAVGMALSMSSTALVFQIIEEKNLMKTPLGENAFSVLLFQDIAVIPILVVLPFLALSPVETHGHHESIISGLSGWMKSLVIVLVISGVILGGKYFSRSLFRLVAKTNLREIFTATSLALVVGITLLMQMVGISPALGAFVAGVTLANSEYRRTIETDIEPFKGLLLGLFFISVGMGMDFNLFFKHPINLVGVVFLIVLIKALILFGLGKLFKLRMLHNSGFAFLMSQVGEFAFVLFQVAGGLKLLNQEQVKFLNFVVALSFALTPFLMIIYNKFIVPRFMSQLPQRDFDTIEQKHPIIMAGFGRFGQVVGRFLMGQGVKLTVLENNPDQIELLRKFGFKGYFGDASRLDLLRGAGAAKAEMLIIAVDDPDTCLTIARIAVEEFPNLKICARARNRRHAYELHKLGIKCIKRETFDSSLTMAKQIMIFLGKKESDMEAKAKQFMLHDEATLKKSFEFFDNEPEMVNFSRLRREELEKILQEDVQETRV